ncbi:hypothetical protein H8E77_22015 [bacterium]|nr:hypothetical protein [bacterium]
MSFNKDNLDDDFIEAQRQKAIYKWKWRNPYLVAFLTFLHPFGMLLSSIPIFFVYLIISIIIQPLWLYLSKAIMIIITLTLSTIFAAIAYHNTLWKNGAIETWKYGLPGTGKDNPKKLGLKPKQERD